MLDTSCQDLRIGFRLLAKEKGFAGIAVAVLALGICAVATQFSVVDAVFLRGFSFPNADRLVSVQLIDPTQTTPFGVNSQIFPLDYLDLREQQKSLDRMSAYLNGSTVNMTVDGNPQRYTGGYVTEDFFRVLGVRPILGRDFEAADNAPGAPKVAIIGHQLWQRDFGGRADVLNKAVRLNGKPATIIGVMEKGFAFPQNEQLWIPLFNEFPPVARNDQNSAANGVAIMATLRPGTRVEQANAEYAGLAERLAKAYPDTNKAYATALVQPLIRTFSPQFLRGLLFTMLGFCVGVLMLACVNVMNMQFARATLRAKELAIRASLGATRWRLIRQMLTESSLVAGIGAILGVGGTFWTNRLLDRALHGLPNPIPAYIEFRINGPVLIFVAAAAAVAALVSGLIPAALASRPNPAVMLKDSGRGNTGRIVGLLNRGLVVFQIAVTCVLLIGSILQLRSILKQQRIDYGYDTRGVLSARMGLMEGDYPDSDRRKLFYDRLLRELRADGEYERVAMTTRFQMIFSGNGPIEVEGKTYKENRDRPNANFENVSDGFFATLGAKILEGRDFSVEDLDARLPVVIVNAAFAKKHFPTESALGHRVRTVDASGTQFGAWRTIVGVVSNLRMTGPFNNPNVDDTGFYAPFYASIFGPLATEPAAPQFATVVVQPHPGQDAAKMANTLRRDAAKLDPNLPLYFVATPAVNIDGFLGQNRIIATMFSVFGVIAVILSAVGLYGVMSFSVNQRTQEFGTRMALGADRQRILRMVLRQGLRQLGLGLGIGLVLALAIAQVGGGGIRQALFQVDPRDPLTYLSVSLLITLVAFVATLLPARRATRVDPVLALRAE
ncbi:MAG: ABC transporter permease [Thermoanaerobaculia bacterium]